jgi:DHA1 family purine base/nucleoside efflux pump-like MFS transporter
MRISPLAALTAATFAVGLGELAVAGILPPLAADLGVGIPAAGQLVGVYALAFAFLTPPLAAAFGGPRRKSGLLVGLLVVCIANVLAALAPNYILLMAARVLAAAGSAVVSPLALSLIDDVVPAERRGRAQGIVFAGFSVAMTLGLPLGAIIAAHAHWRVVFALVAVSCVAAALLAPGLRVPSATSAGIAFRWDRALRAMTPLIMRILAVSFVAMVAQYTVFTYQRPYLAETGPFDLNESALLLFVSGLTGIAGNIGGGMALDRFGERRAMLVCIGTNVFLFALMRFVHAPLGVMVVLFIVWGVVSWAFAPAVNHALAKAAGDHRDIALALNMTAMNLGIAAGSGIGGAIIATSDVANIVAGGAVLLAIAFAIAVPLPQGQRQARPPAAHCS